MAVLLPPIPNDPISETHAWREWFIRMREVIAIPSTTIFHNLLGGLQGGSTNNYYHLTSTQLARVKSNQVLTWLSM